MTFTRARSIRAAGALVLLASLTAAGCSSDDAGAEEASGATSTAPAPEYDFSAVAPIVEAFVAENGLNGAGLVVVDEDEGIIDEQYFGEFDADRVSLVASASKMVTAGVLVRLADQGLLDLDEPIAGYVDWAEGANPEITVAQLLSGSSGLVGLLPNPGYGPYVCQFLPSVELEECAATAWTTTGDDADVVPPDTEFRYGGVQWQIAGAVAETVSGTPWSQLLEETYVEPCGVESLGYSNHWTVLGEGGFTYPAEFGGDTSLLPETENPHMEGGLYIDPVDYAELLLMQLRDGRCGDTQVLEPESVELMHADRVGETYGGATMTGTGYGLGWWVDRDGSNRISDAGAYGAVPWLDLDGGFGGYLVLEADARLGATLAAQLYEPVEAAITAAR
ncbi:CubicO group peptidase, beta-lactamase class C family [Blastococcus fimeti]|nr:CubicO group peptidase, beta-lactamase class C family [Blastococcus fimeti]